MGTKTPGGLAAGELSSSQLIDQLLRRIAAADPKLHAFVEVREEIRAEAVVCALPAGPLRAVQITGLSDARLASLRALRQALAAKLVVAYTDSFWQRTGQNGLADPDPSSPGSPNSPKAKVLS